jgi:hypothetical protein
MMPPMKYRHISQAGIAFAREQGGLAAPDREVGVHARAVIFLDRLGHEGGRLAIGMRDLMHDVLVDLHAVGGLRQRAEGQAQLVLRGCDLVVMLVAGQAHFEHRRDHLAADVDRRVDRRDGEIAALGARTVAEVAAFILAAGVGRQLDIVDLEVRLGVVRVELHVVEHEEFGFRADVYGVADARGLQIRLGALGGRARIAGVEFAGRGFDDVAEHDQHRGGRERIGVDRVEIGLQDHVRLVDRLPALDRGAVEHQAVGEFIFAHHAGDHGEVLPLALGVGEAQIDPLDLLVLDLVQDVVGGRHGKPFALVMTRPGPEGCCVAGVPITQIVAPRQMTKMSDGD